MDVNAYSKVEPYVASLKSFCFKLTPNQWDAEDLMQETLIKLHRSIQASPDRSLSKAFVQRIAKNAWIDKCRKKQSTGPGFDEEFHLPKPGLVSEMEVREVFEQLAYRLNPRQMVFILIMDVFQFTAAETAGS